MVAATRRDDRGTVVEDRAWAGSKSDSERRELFGGGRTDADVSDRRKAQRIVLNLPSGSTISSNAKALAPSPARPCSARSRTTPRRSWTSSYDAIGPHGYGSDPPPVNDPLSPSGPITDRGLRTDSVERVRRFGRRVSGWMWIAAKSRNGEADLIAAAVGHSARIGLPELDGIVHVRHVYARVTF